MANTSNTNRGNARQPRDEDGQFTSRGGNGNSRSDSSSHKSAGGSSNRSDNPGNFANDRERASEAGRKGGQNSHGGRSSSSSWDE